MTESPLVSVITPSFNQGRFIRETIESVVEQGYPHLQYIIVDGGSTDDTEAVVRPFLDRLTWISEPDEGQSEAINKGFRRARGEIVSWVNSDDLLLPGAIATVVEAFRSRPRAGCVYGDGYLIDASGRVTRRFPCSSPMNLWKLIHFSDFILQPAAWFRRDALEQVGYLDESLRFGMDWDLLIRLGKRYPFVYVPKPLASQREYPETKTSAGGWNRFRELVSIVRRHGELRFPPAYFGYGLDTMQKVLGAAIGDRLSARWKERFDRAVKHAGERLLAPMYARYEDHVGWGDGWAGAVTQLLLVRESDWLQLRATVPKEFEELEGQVLSVFVNGELAETLEPVRGDCEFAFRLPAGAQGSLTSIRLQARRSFVPDRKLGNGDPRRLSFLLRDVRWIEERDPLLRSRLGWDFDGWATPRVALSLAPGIDRIAVRGSIPESCPRLAGQSIRIMHENDRLLESSLTFGDFELVIPLGGASPGPVRLTLEASRHFVPKDEGANHGSRRLCYMISEVTRA